MAEEAKKKSEEVSEEAKPKAKAKPKKKEAAVEGQQITIDAKSGLDWHGIITEFESQYEAAATNPQKAGRIIAMLVVRALIVASKL